jgi:hypothetical protein
VRWLETDVDRWVRIGLKMKFKWESEEGFWAKQEGKHRDRWWYWEYPHTKLVECELCGFRSTPKKVSHRGDTFGWNFESRKDYTTKTKSTLCMGCWNKVRPIVKRQEEAEECRSIINKINRSISDERKNQNNRATSQLSSGHDARC